MYVYMNIYIHVYIWICNFNRRFAEHAGIFIYEYCICFYCINIYSGDLIQSLAIYVYISINIHVWICNFNRRFAEHAGNIYMNVGYVYIIYIYICAYWIHIYSRGSFQQLNIYMYIWIYIYMYRYEYATSTVKICWACR
jgi:hypothetical protein